MEFSIFLIAPLSGQGPLAEVYEAVMREVRLADELGFDGLWAAEHHFDSEFSVSPSPNLFLAAASQITSRITLGCGINVLPFHRPSRLAEEGAMLDVLSKGRFQWGIGRGITGHEFASFGVDPSRSRQIFNETHDAVVGAWTTGRMDYHGEFVDVTDTEITPRVVQTPHPPVWVTAQSPDSVVWAAQHDYPAMQIGESLDDGRKHLERYRDAARAHGVTTQRGGIVPLRFVAIADSDDEADELAGARSLGFWEHAARTTAPDSRASLGGHEGKGYEYWRNNNPTRHAALGYEGLKDAGLVIAGSPDTVIKAIQRQIDALECSHLMCDFWRPLATQHRERAMRLFATEVMPAFA
ncbi:MAG TPA: LLM class flavin-dependent oxidoreductase [Acidimicrobiales bacterium]|nr:LLM class flavin-dependent oxidoreductase [Acidimicrobiales bacterium]